MKTAEEWTNELFKEAITLNLLKQRIKAIQLDAWKAGMEQAYDICLYNDNHLEACEIIVKQIDFAQIGPSKP